MHVTVGHLSFRALIFYILSYECRISVIFVLNGRLLRVLYFDVLCGIFGSVVRSPEFPRNSDFVGVAALFLLTDFWGGVRLAGASHQRTERQRVPQVRPAGAACAWNWAKMGFEVLFCEF